VRYQDVAVQIDPLHFFFARERVTSFRGTVLMALNETVSPDFVLNFTLMGFFSVLIVTNLTCPDAMRPYYQGHPARDRLLTSKSVRIAAAAPAVYQCFHIVNKYKFAAGQKGSDGFARNGAAGLL
jgi:hypothetical protein